MQGRSIRWCARVAGVLLCAGLVAWLALDRPLPAQSPASQSAGQSSGQNAIQTEDTGVFTSAHATNFDAVREFFGYRPKPVQPIQFTHKVHIANGLPCVMCHTGVDQGPDAAIPSVTLCMGCHAAIATDKPEIKKLAAYQARGEDVPWQRVYGFEAEAHVKFNHAPHIAAGVDCSTCHGDLSKQTVAERSVNHTMGFCISCHQQKKASIDCVTCHY